MKRIPKDVVAADIDLDEVTMVEKEHADVVVLLGLHLGLFRLMLGLLVLMLVHHLVHLQCPVQPPQAVLLAVILIDLLLCSLPVTFLVYLHRHLHLLFHHHHRQFQGCCLVMKLNVNSLLTTCATKF
jgi:hypothetical protein